MDSRGDTELFQALLEAAPDAVIVVDSDGKMMLVNGQAERIFGWSRAELVGSPVDLLVPERFRASHHAGHLDYLRAPRLRPMEQGHEVPAVRKDGTEFIAEISLSPLATPNGVIVTAVVRDVTDQKRLQGQLLVSDRMASLGTLAAGVAHEINNPLTAVIANLDVALRRVGRLGGGAARELEEVLGEAAVAADRVRQIVRDLKLLSRGDDERRGRVELGPVIDSCLRMAWNEIRHRAHVVKDVPLLPAVEGNEARLGQVFLNLIVNAAQAMPEGEADRNRLHIRGAVEPRGVIIEVSDTGAGIPPAALPRIFDPFFTTKAIGVGTGLGLAISQRIVTGLGGRIEVESQAGQGTTFRVVLPPAGAHAGAGDRAAASPAPVRRGRILVIDDEASVGAAVRRIFQAEHEVLAVTSAAAAMPLLAAGQRFDVILCDLMMPVVSGMDFHAELQRVAPDAAAGVVFMTGGAFTPRAREFLEQVANARVEKPFAVEDLRALINSRVR